MTPEGILLIDKPRGMTSHDVVARVRRVAATRQVGHTGTLDPMAEGLMIVCVGRATRVAQFLVGLDKTYVGAITLGAVSSTYDAEGSVIPQGRPVPGDAAVLADAMRRLEGEQVQLPPPYSAVKVAGKKLYEYARNGEEVPQKPRRVRVHGFRLLRYDAPVAQFEARVGSGTYIRSMAHDLGAALGCGAYLSQLRRTQVGGFSDEQAVPLETLITDPGLLEPRLLSVTEALGHLPKVTVMPAAERAVLNGRPFGTREVMEFDGILTPGRPVLVLDQVGRALSVAQPVVAVESEEGLRAAPDERGSGEPDELDPFGAAGAQAVIGGEAWVFKPLRVLTRE